MSPLSSGGSIVYWSVKDLQVTLDKAIAMGAGIYRGPLFVKETSRTIVQIQDPFGNVFGIEN